jgi:hypothetical protein
MSRLLCLQGDLWSISGDAGFMVSSLVSSASACFSFHLLTGKMGTRPFSAYGALVLNMSRHYPIQRNTSALPFSPQLSAVLAD